MRSASAAVGHAALGGRHLGHAGHPDEGVGHERWRAPVEGRADELLADGVRRPGRRVVVAPGLEVDLLERPAHRPVDLPDELALVLGREVGDAGERTGGAGVAQVGRVVVVGGDGDGVASALAAVGLVGEPHQRRGGVGSGRAVVIGIGGGRLGAEARHHRLDLVTLGDGVQDLLAVGAGPVHLGLRHLLHLHAHLAQGSDERLLVVLGPGVVAAVGVGHRGERTADVVGPGGVDAGRHLAEAVVVVPAVQVTHGQSAATDLLGDEVHREELAQVAEVDRPGRTGPRGAGDELGALTGVPDRVVSGAGHPVGGVAAGALVCSSSTCHRRGL